MEPDWCAICGRVLPGGHPRKRYCSAACRRLAEFAIRRLTRQLDGLEAQLLSAEHDLVPLVPATPDELARLRSARDAVESRLRALLDDDEEAQ